jgi:di/tricarboxylate transporter
MTTPDAARSSAMGPSVVSPNRRTKMSPELWSVIALVAVFVAGTLLNINLGILALTAAFILAATVAGVPLDELYPLFPSDLVILLVALLFFLSVAKATGVIDWLVNVAVAGARGRMILIPWMLFALSAVTAALGPGAIPLLAGIAVTFARRYNISRLLLALMIVHGAQAGGFSPITPYSVLMRGLVENAGYVFEPMVLFIGAAVFNTLAAVIGFTALGGWKLARRSEHIGQKVMVGAAGSSAGANASAEETSSDLPVGALGLNAPAVAEVTITAPPTLTGIGTDSRGHLLRPTFLQVVALVTIVALVAAAGVLHFDLAATTLVLAVILAIVVPARMRKGTIESMSWSAVILIAGMITLMSLLQQMGTVQWAVGLLGGVGSPLLALLLVCYIAGLVSAVASSFATLVATVPLALAIASDAGIGSFGAALIITAIVVASTIVDISPFSTYGAMVLGAAEPEEQNVFQRSLMKYAGVIVVLAPGAAWLLLIVPAWLLA